jgi:hypothetical protein
MQLSRPDLEFSPALPKPDLKQTLGSSLGLACCLTAISMFFLFPGVEAWTVSVLDPLASQNRLGMNPRVWITLLLVSVVALPGVLGPLLLIARARRLGDAKLIMGCLVLAGLYVTAAFAAPLLCGRVALLALLSGQLLALGEKAPASVPYNWMVYLGFVIANLNFPDAGILAAANVFAGAYLAGTGVFMLVKKLSPPRKKDGYRVMVG